MTRARELVAYFEERRNRALDLLERLVAIDSPTSDKGGVDRVAALLAEELRAADASVDIIRQERAGDVLRASFGRRGDQLEEATIEPATRTKDRFECLRAAKPIPTAAAGAQASNRSDAKPRSALGPTRREHLASADRLHAASKAVLAGAAKLRGLKCAFHGSGVIICWRGSAASEWPGEAAWAREMAAEKPYIRAR